MAYNAALGSIWKRWDLHVHTNDTIKENEFTGDWDKYIQIVENASNDISVIGATDYFRIEGYKKLKEEKATGKMANIDLIIPNIEFRLSLRGRNGQMNIHLLINPSEDRHIAKVESALSRLTFTSNRQPYPCNENGFRDLGEAILRQEHKLGNHDDAALIQEGLSKFAPSFEEFETWYEKETWLKNNSIVVIPNGDDGIGVIPVEGGGAELRNNICRFADAIFSSNPTDRSYYLGLGTDSPAVLLTKIGGIKPCIHGSDAHKYEKMFEPDEQRYCWIKANPTFEGLKQILFEPDERVFIGISPPNQRYPDRVIKKISLNKTPNWYKLPEIELNSGYVAIIGNKGAGKTALADMVSHGTGAWDQKESGSFINKAMKEIKGTEITIEWQDDHTSNTIIDPKKYDETNKEVKYLSQQFVESLCSKDQKGTELRAEIEKVVFSYIPETETLDSSDFDELRQKRTSAALIKKDDAQEKLSKNLIEYITLNEQLASKPEKVSRTNRLKEDIAKIKKDMPAEEDEEKALTENITALRERETKLIQDISSKNLKIDKLEKLSGRIEKLQIQLSERVTDLSQLLKDAEVSDDAVNTLPIFNGSQIKEELDKKIQSWRSEVLEKAGQKYTPADLPKLEDLPDIDEMTLEQVKYKIEALEKQESKDKEKRNKINLSIKDIQDLEKKIKILENEIAYIDTQILARKQEVTSFILNTYKEFFSALEEEGQQLEKLYAPLKEKLGDGEEHEKRLTFYIQRSVDHIAWCKRGYDIFNATKIKQTNLGDLDSFIERVEKRLLDAWNINDLNVIVSETQSILQDLEKSTSPEDLTKGSYGIKDIYTWLFSVEHISISYGMKYDGISLEKLSPGTKGVILLMLYLEMNQSDIRPLIVDQPEENLDNQSVYGILKAYFRKAKKRRQIIVITHNPNLVVNTDADQIIVAQTHEDEKLDIRPISYISGALENSKESDPNAVGIRELVCDILEGGKEAFRMRDQRYRH